MNFNNHLDFKNFNLNFGKFTHDVKSQFARVDPRQHEDTRAVHLLITEEKNIWTSYKTLAYEKGQTAKVLYDWGKTEGEDLDDITDKLRQLLTKQAEIESAFATKYQQYRSTLKSIRVREEALFDSRQKKRDLQMRIQNLQKTSPRSTKLKEFQHELVALDHETQEQETGLADFKRFALREAFYIQFNALFEVAEKTAILAGFGRYIIDEIDVTPTVTGEKRPEYKGGRQTAQVLADALEAVNGWHAPELDERPTLTQKVGAEAFYQQDNDSGENMALSRHPSTRMAQLQHDAAEHAVSADDVDVGIDASSRSRDRLASVTSQDSQESDAMSLYASMPSPPLTRERLASHDSVESDTTPLYASLPSPPLTRDNLTSDSSSTTFALYPSTPSPPVSRQTMFMTPQDSVASLASLSSLPSRQSTRESVASPPERQETVASLSGRQETLASLPGRQETLASQRERQETLAPQRDRQLSTDSSITVVVAGSTRVETSTTIRSDEAAFDNLPSPPPAYPVTQKPAEEPAEEPNEYQKPSEYEPVPVVHHPSRALSTDSIEEFHSTVITNKRVSIATTTVAAAAPATTTATTTKTESTETKETLTAEAATGSTSLARAVSKHEVSLTAEAATGSTSLARAVSKHEVPLTAEAATGSTSLARAVSKHEVPLTAEAATGSTSLARAVSKHQVPPDAEVVAAMAAGAAAAAYTDDKIQVEDGPAPGLFSSPLQAHTSPYQSAVPSPLQAHTSPYQSAVPSPLQAHTSPYQSAVPSPLQAHTSPYQSAVPSPPQGYANTLAPQATAPYPTYTTYNYGQLYQQAQQVAAPAPRPYSEFAQHFAYAQQQYGTQQQPTYWHPQQGPQYSGSPSPAQTPALAAAQRADNVGGFVIRDGDNAAGRLTQSPVPLPARTATTASVAPAKPPRGDNIGGFVLPKGGPMSAEEEKKMLAERDAKEAAALAKQQQQQQGRPGQQGQPGQPGQQQQGTYRQV